MNYEQELDISKKIISQFLMLMGRRASDEVVDSWVNHFNPREVSPEVLASACKKMAKEHTGILNPASLWVFVRQAKTEKGNSRQQVECSLCHGMGRIVEKRKDEYYESWTLAKDAPITSSFVYACGCENGSVYQGNHAMHPSYL